MSNKQLDYLRILVLTENTVGHGRRLLAQHGISFLVEARTGETSKRIVVDVGQNYAALRHNMDLLGINPRDIDMVVLTHCHYDHTTGVAALLTDIGKDDLPVIAHPDSFRLNFVTDPYLRHSGVAQGNQAPDITSNGGRLYLTRDPLQLMPGLSTTGEVPRVTDFEEVGLNLYTIRNGRTVRDDMIDDISLVANVKDHGIVVITGCSHAGIVNIIRQAMTMYPGEKLDGVVGGFHLLEAPEDRIKRTVEEINKQNPRWISAGHCTGFRAQMALYAGLADRFVPLSCGKEFIIPPP
ncbi:MAG TPA: MBL fold metallo-hydrolase [Firmicutes bacterium]|nr:MBL fold metallo-hydrolase [Bacillota bacterium]